VAAEAEYAMRQSGAEEFYRTYVCSGPRTNIAHGLPTQRKLQKGDLVMIDIHPIVNGYSADMCRTVCVGKPTAEQQDAYNAFLKAQQATIAKVKAGVSMVELEATIHGALKEAGHSDHIFGPPMHGLGIEFEEAPLPAGHAFFHGKSATAVKANTGWWVTAVCAAGPAREDTARGDGRKCHAHPRVGDQRLAANGSAIACAPQGGKTGKQEIETSCRKHSNSYRRRGGGWRGISDCKADFVKWRLSAADSRVRI
jgi:methionine aminopeptidase